MTCLGVQVMRRFRKKVLTAQQVWRDYWTSTQARLRSLMLRMDEVERDSRERCVRDTDDIENAACPCTYFRSNFLRARRLRQKAHDRRNRACGFPVCGSVPTTNNVADRGVCLAPSVVMAAQDLGVEDMPPLPKVPPKLKHRCVPGAWLGWCSDFACGVSARCRG